MTHQTHVEEPRLTGVQETMLRTLYNRATESLRADAWLRDRDAVRIYRAINYPYERHFGSPDSSHAVRSLLFDSAVKQWMVTHPRGIVVELACGLETQFQRCDDGQVRWLCIDVPEAIDVRERFLSPTERCRHLRMSALDLDWIDEVDPTAGVFLTAQGLLMYFDEPEVRQLLSAIVERFPGAQLMFDTIPRWLSAKTGQRARRLENAALPRAAVPLGRQTRRDRAHGAHLVSRRERVERDAVSTHERHAGPLAALGRT